MELSTTVTTDKHLFFNFFFRDNTEWLNEVYERKGENENINTAYQSPGKPGNWQETVIKK